MATEVLGDGASVARYHALTRVSTTIAAQRTVADLFAVLCEQLHEVVPFDFLALTLHDSNRDMMRLTQLEPADMPRPTVSELPVSEHGPAAHAWLTQQPFIVAIREDEPLGPALDYLRTHGRKVACCLPLTTARNKLGVLAFGSSRESDYPGGTIAFMQQVAAQVAVAVENATNYDRALDYEAQLTDERDRLRLVLDANQLLVSQLEFRALLETISRVLQRVVPHEYASITLHDPDSGEFRVKAVLYHDARGVIQPDVAIPVDRSPAGVAFTENAVRVFHGDELDRFPAEAMPTLRAGALREVCAVPLATARRRLGALTLARLDEGFAPPEVARIRDVSAQIAIAVENALAYGEIAVSNERLVNEKLYLEDEIRLQREFGEIVGDSPAITRVLKTIETVAPTDATVLLLGETGTGKELLARAVHRLSPRRERSFVRLNVAALPATLVESELFGYERGAFTGATGGRMGRLALADRGTLFLDEVGDLPLDVQPKLLRVLQEREFERLGSSRTERVNVRLIAATNRDLELMVAEGVFRSDLFYRLHVFPIRIPPLRERPEDIAPLVRHFVKKFAERFGRRITTIPAEAMDRLTAYSWPGNIRELENVIEHAVILSPGATLQLEFELLRPPRLAHAPQEPAASETSTFRDSERDAILAALRASNGVVAGPDGAAARLGLKRTTLQSKMRKLGIKRPSY